MAVGGFPYDPEFGEPYNSRERFFVERPAYGRVVACGPAPARGGPDRVAIYVRGQLLELVDEVVRFARDTTALAARHVDTLMPDQTYLQQAQPSTFGHYVLSFAYPAMMASARPTLRWSVARTVEEPGSDIPRPSARRAWSTPCPSRCSGPRTPSAPPRVRPGRRPTTHRDDIRRRGARDLAPDDMLSPRNVPARAGPLPNMMAGTSALAAPIS